MSVHEEDLRGADTRQDSVRDLKLDTKTKRTVRAQNKKERLLVQD